MVEAAPPCRLGGECIVRVAAALKCMREVIVKNDTKSMVYHGVGARGR
jgi:hypothetical protein